MGDCAEANSDVWELYSMVVKIGSGFIISHSVDIEAHP